MDGISIIVCCYNSANRIQKTLEHLFLQEPQGVKYEILLINNNCSDNTVAIAESLNLQRNNFIPFRIIDEPTPGLSFAREKGIENSKYKFILFCDDDNWLDSRYISLAYKLMNANSNIGVLGGRGEPVSDISLPFWFSTFQGCYAIGTQSLDSGDISNRGYVWGAGMVLRKEVYELFKNAGFNPILSDRKGNDLVSGGDSEICKWFLLAGYKLWYDENLCFKHYVPAERLTKEYCQKLLAGFGESSRSISYYQALLEAKYENKALKKLTKFLYNSVRSLVSKNHHYLTYAEAYSFIPLPVFSLEVYKMKKNLRKIRSFK